MNTKLTPEHHAAQSAPIHHQDRATPAAAQSETDPVCGMSVAANDERYVEHQGHKYYFCSNGCKTKFAADPERYLKPKIPSTAKPKAGAIFTCPMHPEIRRDRPGSCPICGMALEPLNVSLDDADDSELRSMLLRFRIGVGRACRGGPGGAGDSRGVMGRMAVLRAGMAFLSHLEPEHVQPDRARHRR